MSRGYLVAMSSSSSIGLWSHRELDVKDRWMSDALIHPIFVLRSSPDEKLGPGVDAPRTGRHRSTCPSVVAVLFVTHHQTPSTAFEKICGVSWMLTLTSS